MAGSGWNPRCARSSWPRATTPTSRRFSGYAVGLPHRRAAPGGPRRTAPPAPGRRRRAASASRPSRCRRPSRGPASAPGRGRSSPCRARRSGRGRCRGRTGRAPAPAPPRHPPARRRRCSPGARVAGRAPEARAVVVLDEDDEVPALAEAGAGSPLRGIQDRLEGGRTGRVGRGRSAAPCGAAGPRLRTPWAHPVVASVVAAEDPRTLPARLADDPPPSTANPGPPCGVHEA